MRTRTFLLIFLAWLALVVIAIVPTETCHAEGVDFATWSPPGTERLHLRWQGIGENERGAYYVAVSRSDYATIITVKQLVKGMSGKLVMLTFSDFNAQCGPNGEPPDEIRSISVISIEPRTLSYVSQIASPDAYGTPLNPVPGSVLARAVIVGCYLGSHK